MRLLCFAAVAGLFCLFPLVLAAPANGQAAPPATPSAPAGFDQEPVILRDSQLRMQYNADGTGTRTESQVFTLQTDAAVRRFGVVPLLYASATQTAEFVFVRVRHADGTTVETPLDGVQDQPAPVTQQAPFYSDLKIKQLPVRGLRVGDTVEWQTRTTITHPEAPNQFWISLPFVREVVTLNQTMEVRFPTSTHATVWTNPANHVTPQRTTKGADTVYTWQWSSLKPTVGKEADAAKKAAEGKLLTADEELDETEGRLPDIAVTTFPDWAAVGAWYRSLSADRVQPDATVRAKVAEITAHSTTQQQKVQAVYDWVSVNIRYIGVAFGIGRFQPHAAATVLENQYGDCKDKHTLLASMLLVLGEHPDAVLIGFGVRFNQAVPSPAAFNHLITHLTLDGKPVWLDSTAEVAGFQVLNPVLRDKQALVIPPSAPAGIQRTPAADPFAPTQAMQVVGSLDKDLNSDSDMTLTLHDDSELVVRAVLHQVSSAQYTELAQRMMQGMSFGGTVTDASFGNTGDLEKPLEIHFHYHRDRNPDWGFNRVTLAFSPTEVPAVDSKSPPPRSIQLGQPRTSTSTVDMRLPAGWTAELPEAIHAHLPQVGIDTVYHLNGDHLQAERTVHILSEKIPASDWKSYRKWYDDANAGDVPYVQLMPVVTRSSTTDVPAHVDVVPAGPAKPEPAPAEASPAAHEQARKLVETASDQMNHNDLDGAEKSLDAAAALDRSVARLDGDRGAIAFRRGKIDEALALDKKEVGAHPASTFAWRNLLAIEFRRNHQAAENEAQQWVQAEPGLLEAHVAYIGLLSTNAKPAEALKAALHAAKEMPAATDESPEFQLLLGKVQTAAGDRSAAVATFAAMLKPDTRAILRNDAAYELAKLHEKLTESNAAQREVLQALTDESTTWTGDERSATLLVSSRELTAAWDTYGFILHQQGRDAEAKPYVEAAWRNRQGREIGEHLGDIEMALHHAETARLVYQLADRAQPNEPDSSLHKKAQDAAQQDGAEHKQRDLAAEAKRLRTFPAAGHNTSARTTDYLVLVRSSGVQRVKALQEDALPDQQAIVRSAPLQQLLPAGSAAVLAVNVTLRCTAEACDVTLQP